MDCFLAFDAARILAVRPTTYCLPGRPWRTYCGVLVDRDRFVRLLWELGFEYVTNSSAGQVYWRGGQKVIEVPKAETLEYAWAFDSLVRCGLLLSEAIGHLRDTLA